MVRFTLKPADPISTSYKSKMYTSPSMLSLRVKRLVVRKDSMVVNLVWKVVGASGGDRVWKAKSSGVVGEGVSVMSIAIDDEDVPLVDGVLDGALGAFGDRGCYFGDGILASSCVRLMNNFLGEIIMIFGFLEALEVEVCEDAMEEFEVENE
ncbi:hypothetical protein Tco_0798618 [Tanacetum coccineum]